MTPTIPPIERPTRLRRAVFDITLRDGVAGITQSAVAKQVGTSLASVRRLGPAQLLPQYGLEWVLKQQRVHQFKRVPGEVDAVARHHRALNCLLRDLPLDDERRDEERVWWLLTSNYPHDPWFREASEERAEWTTKVVAAIVEGLPPSAIERERIRLTALVHGAVVGVRDSLIDPTETVALVRDWVLELDAQRTVAEPKPGAA